ncbi:MAG: hypothetical protein H0X24_11185 [Ktedonobacterales bacterium]|nr:hypothetical protein [Ktedonobacterales bacterium]
MTPQRPRKVRFAFAIVSLALLVVALVATVSVTKAAAPTPSTPTPNLNRFYFPKNSVGKGPQAVHPQSTRNNLRHGSGPVIHSSTTYAIFWEPSHLQDGSTTSVSSGYNSLQTQFLSDVGNTSFYNIMTQYYDANTVPGHIQNSSTFGGSYVDTSAYPAHGSDCNTQGSSNPTNCISDSQMQAEITKAQNANGWATSPSSIFILFTSRGEDTCSNIVGGCSSTVYCGFHYYFGSQSQPYAILPYNGSGQGCDAGQATPNNNTDADYEISTVSHELFEAVTDPQPNRNWTGPLGEIGDACGYKYGTIGLDGGKANESLHGHFYTTQMEWSNAIGNCAQTR